MTVVIAMSSDVCITGYCASVTVLTPSRRPYNSVTLALAGATVGLNISAMARITLVLITLATAGATVVSVNWTLAGTTVVVGSSCMWHPMTFSTSMYTETRCGIGRIRSYWDE